MSNSYYTHTTYPTPNSPGSSAQMRAQLELVTVGFDLLPTLAANGYKVAMVNSAGTALIASAALQALAITASTINSTTIGATTASTGAFTTVSASSGFTGNITGNITGNVTGNLTGNVVGNVTSSGSNSFASAIISGGTIDNTTLGATTASTVRGTTVTATVGFVGGLTGNVVGNVTGNLTGNSAGLHTGAVTGNVTGNLAGVVTGSGTSTFTAITMSGAIAMGAAKITGLGDPTSAQDAATKTYTDNALALRLALTGGTMSGAIAMGTAKITGLGEPTLAQDAATKNYVDNLSQGLDAKASCRVATTANITLSGAQTIDGIAVIAADRVLVKDQTTTANNGIYLCASGAWTRTTDADTWAELPAAFVFVEVGTLNANNGYVCTVADGGTLGTTAITWVHFSGAGQITAGLGLTKTGNTLNVGTASSSRIVVNADDIDLATTGVSAATYQSITVDTYGRITAGTNPTTIAGYNISNAYTTAQVDTALALKLNLSGGTLSGALAMGTNKITGVGDPTNPQDASTKNYTDVLFGSTAAAATSAAAAAASQAAALASQNSATSSASAASASQTAAAASATASAASYDSFDDRYLGPKSSPPSLDNDGNALLTGALYFDTVGNLMKVYTGTAWVNAGSAVNGTAERRVYIATAAQTTFTATYDVGYVDVYLNGAKQQVDVDFTATNGTSVVFSTGLTSGDLVDIVAYGSFSIANVYTQVQSDARFLQLANNLSDLTNATTARSNLGLGTAATTASSAYATSAQGTLAGTALQAAAIGTTIQAYNANLTTWAGTTIPSGTVVGTSDTQTLTNKTLAAPVLTSPNITTALTLTSAAGSSGQVLTSAGAGAAPTWTTPSVTAPAGSTGQVQYNNAGVFGAVSTGTSGQILTSAGAGAAPTWSSPATGGFSNMAVFTSSGTWSVPAGVIKCKVTVTGGGGGAGNAYAGGAGGTSIKIVSLSGSSATITIGAGGPINTTGAAGTSSFVYGGTTVSATGGGNGSTGSGYSPTAGGYGTGGDINISGGGGDGNTTYSIGGGSYWGGGANWSGNGAYGSGGGFYGNVGSNAGYQGMVVIEY